MEVEAIVMENKDIIQINMKDEQINRNQGNAMG